MINIETFFNTKDIKRFFFPGKILWGNNCRYLLPELIGPDRTIAFFVDDFFAESDFVKEFQQRFNKQIVLIEKITSMPKTENVKRIISQLGKVPDVVISIGGGSSIDTAKAVVASFIYGTFDGIGIGERLGIPTLKGIAKPIFISLPTTAGTGADASRYYVIYDSETHVKVHGKSWELIADWILLDAFFIRDLSDRLLVNFAFDAFIHFFESYLCRYERSWFGEMLSLDGMLRIIYSLDRIIHYKERKDEHFLKLLYTATISGVAISNVRTGIIHEAAGALLEHTELTHPETLFVFLRSTYEQYRQYITEKEDMLVRRAKSEYGHFSLSSFERVVEWWEDIYEHTGIRMHIMERISAGDIAPYDLKLAIFNRVFSDKVWIEKEGPLALNENMVKSFIETSLARFNLERRF